jgi:hypothetical protein
VSGCKETGILSILEKYSNMDFHENPPIATEYFYELYRFFEKYLDMDFHENPPQWQ